MIEDYKHVSNENELQGRKVECVRSLGESVLNVIEGNRVGCNMIVRVVNILLCNCHCALHIYSSHVYHSFLDKHRW